MQSLSQRVATSVIRIFLPGADLHRRTAQYRALTDLSCPGFFVTQENDPDREKEERKTNQSFGKSSSSGMTIEERALSLLLPTTDFTEIVGPRERALYPGC